MHLPLICGEDFLKVSLLQTVSASPSPPRRKQIKSILAARGNRSAVSSGRSALRRAPLLLSQLLVTFHLRCSGFSGDVNWITLIRDLIKACGQDGAWADGSRGWQAACVAGAVLVHRRQWAGSSAGAESLAVQLWEEQANRSKVQDGFRWFRLQFGVVFFPETGLDNHSIQL